MREGAAIVGPRRQSAKTAAFTPRNVRARRIFHCLCATALACALAVLLTSCNEGGRATGASPGSDQGQTSGPAFTQPEPALSPFDASAATDVNGALIDASHLSEGYVSVSATSQARLKFQVSSGGLEYNYDLPNDGTPISCPLSEGNATYTFTVWENTSGNRYVELASLPDQNAVLSDEFQPFIRPSVYCNYGPDSAAAKLADQLCADAQNEGDVVRAVYTWIVDNITYDEEKAAALADATGYVPSPDATINAKTGICFDYASLAAAMLRSQGVPCKIITGNVSPDNIYHAWNMIYIDGTWIGAGIDVRQNTWTRIDTTFAAGGASSFIGDGTGYTDRYTY